MQLRDRQQELAIAPLWRLGFRPFFLGGALFAVLAIGLWAAALLGYLPGWQPVGGSLAWHRHELPFGFAVAIIAGFLLTAVQNWTGRPGLSGWPLAALFGLWLLARLAWLFGAPLPLLLALQLPFLPLLALLLGRQLWTVRQWRNYPLVVVVLLMASCEWLLLYGLALGDDALQRRGALAGLWLIAALVSIIGGRVIPFFTQRGLNRAEPAAPRPRLDLLVLVLSLSLALLFASGLTLQPSLWLLPLLLVLAALHLPVTAFGGTLGIGSGSEGDKADGEHGGGRLAAAGLGEGHGLRHGRAPFGFCMVRSSMRSPIEDHATPFTLSRALRAHEELERFVRCPRKVSRWPARPSR